VSCAVGTGDRT